MGFKASETLLGIETDHYAGEDSLPYSFKASETLLGIETSLFRIIYCLPNCFKASETLLGIETNLECDKLTTRLASKPLKPF